ncbi:MAG: hypothetical protein WAU68_14835 [Vitreimonas sp.]
MSALWIDGLTYVGPCRRGGRAGLRLFNRRRSAGSGPAPSLKTLIRQLRMTELSHADDAALARFRLRVRAAADLAAANQETLCAADLAALSVRLEAALDARALSGDAAETLARAAARLP